MKNPTAVERENGNQVESIEDEGEAGDLDEKCFVEKQPDQAEDNTDEYARHGPHERDDHFFPSRDIVMSAGDGGAEEWDKKHAQVAVVENTHGDVVSNFVEK